MNKVVERPKSILRKMAEDKKKVVDYFVSGDESKKPEGVQFVNPFTLPGATK